VPAASGIITILTDFGTADSYVGAMKGAILSAYREATIVDLAHGLQPYAILQAAFLLDGAWRAFPAGTVHAVVVDPGVGTRRPALALAAADHYFVGPDNGVFTFLPEEIAEQVALPIPADASTTFHGRDVFAPAAAHLASGGSLASLGRACAGLTRLEVAAEKVGEAYRALVLHCDRFGNVVTNLPPRALPRLRTVNGRPLRPVRTYEEGADGEIIALLGSSGRIELAVRQASAQDRLQVRAMDTVLVT
jgi:S-adenosyl-L-methionine hydrolase (adenosine-forming)